MIRKRYSPEKIIGMLREAEVCLAQEMTVGQVCRQLSISAQTYYHWRKQYCVVPVGDDSYANISILL